jgi:glucosamine-6-phosphate deaminase
VRLVRGGSLEAWADRVSAELAGRLQAQPELRLCLPTGLTPVPIYDRLAAAAGRGEISFRRAAVFLLDEFGGVGPADPGRCDQMLKRWLIDRVDLPPERFHRFDLTGDVDAECARYEALFAAGCDLTLLGIGGNGHVGMNEPGSPADSVTRRVALDPTTVAASARYFGRETDLPAWGVTIGIGTILRSREIWLIASGAAKAPIVGAILHDPPGPDLPASLLATHPGTVLFADDAAASLA